MHRWSIAFVLLVMTLPVRAADDGRVALTVKASTLGFGADVGFRVTERIHFRGMLQGWDDDERFDDSGVEYDGTIDLESLGFAADFYPTGGGFVLSAGLLANSNSVSAIGLPSPGDTFEIGANTYTTDEIGTLSAEIDFDSTAPFATIGWGNPFAGGRFGFRIEAGGLFQGKPEALLMTTRSVPGLAADLEIERREFQDEVDDFEFWPIVSAGLTIRF